MKTAFGTALMCGALGMGANAANAAVVDFTGGTYLSGESVNVGDPGDGGASPYSTTLSSIGRDMTITAGSSISTPGYPKITQNDQGLGVRSTFADPNYELDGLIGDESLSFDFSGKVNVQSITVWTANWRVIEREVTARFFGIPIAWNNIWGWEAEGDDAVQLTADSGADETLFADSDELFVTFYNPFGSDQIMNFMVDASAWNSEVRIMGMDVQAVPLPAAVWFLLTALGGLFGTRWLKKGQTA
jgi:hypothetical protein